MTDNELRDWQDREAAADRLLNEENERKADAAEYHAKCFAAWLAAVCCVDAEIIKCVETCFVDIRDNEGIEFYHDGTYNDTTVSGAMEALFYIYENGYCPINRDGTFTPIIPITRN